MTSRKDIAMLQNAPEPPEYLSRKIVQGVRNEQRRMVKRRLFVSSLLFTASAALAVLCVLDFNAEISRSGFLSFASLFVSDFSLAVANFHELSLSLVESFPAVSAGFLLGSSVIAAWFAIRAVRTIVMVRRHHFKLLAS